MKTLIIIKSKQLLSQYSYNIMFLSSVVVFLSILLGFNPINITKNSNVILETVFEKGETNLGAKIPAVYPLAPVSQSAIVN